MPILDIRGVSYAYTCYPASTPASPLLLLHGFTGSQRTWHHLVEALHGERTLLTVGLLGHDATSAPPDPARHAMPEAAADLIALLAAIDVPRATVLGYSMGARLALYLALHHPETIDALIMESGSPGLATPEARAARRANDEALAARIEREGVAAFVDAWEGQPLFDTLRRAPASVQAAVRAERLANRPHGLASSLRGMGTGVQPSLWEALPTLRQPAFFLAGALDGKFAGIARAMASAAPHATYACIEAAGHAIHLEQPARFADAVRTFLHTHVDPVLSHPRASPSRKEAPHD
jgi:2-succinyl-6-hydroxy-2,4-cyclohexadiene-1-carboxylate synthase